MKPEFYQLTRITTKPNMEVLFQGFSTTSNLYGNYQDFKDSLKFRNRVEADIGRRYKITDNQNDHNLGRD